MEVCKNSCYSIGTDAYCYRAHLIHDLRPYVCTYPDCHLAAQLYDRRRDWVDHEDAFHRRQWRCSEHVDRLYDTREGYIQHVKTDHQDDVDIMCTERHMRSCESASSKVDRPCPVCFYSASDARASQSHLARHLERFALFSLPRSTEYGEKDDELGSAVAVEAMQSSRALTLEAFDESSADWDSLAVAARVGDLSRVEDIIEGSFASDHDKNVALVEASALGHEAVVRALLDHGANANYTDEDSSPLVTASSSGHLGVVKDLIDHGADVDAVVDFRHDGPNALIAACIGGHLEIVKELTSSQADVNALASFQTALAAAAENGKGQIVQLLLDLGAKPTVSRDDEPSPLAIAAAEGHEDVVNTLLKHGAVQSPKSKDSDLLGVVVRGHLSIVNTLIDAGWDVNWGEHATETVLETAVTSGHIDIVRRLLDAGADPNIHGRAATPLHLSANNGHAGIAKVLIEAGADLDGRNPFNETPLQKACEGGHDDLAKLLIENRADVNASSRRSGTALQIALRSGNQRIADMLRAAGADQNPTEFHMNEFSQDQQQTDINALKPGILHRAWLIQPASPGNKRMTLSLVHDVSYNSQVACVSFSSDGTYLALGMWGAALIFETQGMTEKTKLNHEPVADSDHTGDCFIRSLAFSPDNKFLLTGSEDGMTRLWEILSALEVANTRTSAEVGVYSVAFSPNGALYASGAADGTIELYDTINQNCHSKVFRKHGITSLAFSPDSSLLAVGVLDGEVALVKIDGNIEYSLPSNLGHQDSILGVSWSIDGAELYSAGTDRIIKCWKVVVESDGLSTATYDITGHEVSHATINAPPILTTVAGLCTFHCNHC